MSPLLWGCWALLAVQACVCLCLREYLDENASFTWGFQAHYEKPFKFKLLHILWTTRSPEKNTVIGCSSIFYLSCQAYELHGVNSSTVKQKPLKGNYYLALFIEGEDCLRILWGACGLKRQAHYWGPQHLLPPLLFQGTDFENENSSSTLREKVASQLFTLHELVFESEVIVEVTVVLLQCGVCGKPLGDLRDNMFLPQRTIHCESCYAKVT